MTKDADGGFPSYLDGYGAQQSLQDILEDLAVYCSLHGGGTNPRIEIIIPKAVQEAFTAQFSAKSKFGTTTKPEDLPKLKLLHLNGGVVEIHNSDDKKVVDK